MARLDLSLIFMVFSRLQMGRGWLPNYVSLVFKIPGRVFVKNTHLRGFGSNLDQVVL